ncbi:MAG TPA: hypothetical protein VLW50_17980 [Streptosporangiaceae bacterium]|nr:hypothetical protein [Streptosporangiaceae bacterium]
MRSPPNGTTPIEMPAGNREEVRRGVPEGPAAPVDDRDHGVTKDVAAEPVVARCAAAAASCAQAQRLNEQLTGAPTSRVVTEQGKNGDLRARRVDLAVAFSRLRTCARNTNIRRAGDLQRCTCAGRALIDQRQR